MPPVISKVEFLNSDISVYTPLVLTNYVSKIRTNIFPSITSDYLT